MAAAPRVSVLIATYNRAGTVVEAIESVLRQSFRDLEIIVADDGSTDDTASRIAAIGGPVREPEKLARQVALLDADPALGLVYTGFSILGDDGSVHVPELAPWQKAPGPLLGRLLRGCFIHPSTVLVRRALLERVGGLDEGRAPCEDYDLWLRLAPLTPGACIPEPLARLRRGAINNSVRDRPEREADIHYVSISILEDLLAAGGLDLRHRLRCRAAISNLHVSAARLARKAGDGRRARRHALAALGRNPMNRRAWTGLGRLSVPAPGTASTP
jgi:GT2 family glycosyltransferase